MKRTKDYNTFVKWYISAVKSNLILRSGYMEDEAEKAIRTYQLERRLNECPDIAFHDDPRSIAKVIVKRTTSV